MMHLIWLVPGFPLVGVIVNGLFGRTHIRDRAHWVAIPAAGLSFLVALLIAIQVFAGQTLDLDLYPWVVAGNFQVPVGFLVDPLSTVMMLTVTFVSLLIHVYSVRYMQGDPGYPRYFTYLNLFLFAMLVLVLANNYLLMFFGWEGVGVCSYLLIGFWYERKNASLGLPIFPTSSGGICQIAFARSTWCSFVATSWTRSTASQSHSSLNL